MNLNENQLDILDKFLRGELNQKEAVLWKDMQLDPTVQDEIRNLTHIQQAIVKDGREALRVEMEEFDKPVIAKNDGDRRIFQNRRMLVAASVAILLAALGWVLFKPESTTSSLYADNFQPYPNIISPLQKGSQDVSAYDKAFQFYESGEYESAIRQFELLSEKDEAVEFYKALTWISLGQYKSAEKELAAVVSQSDHRFRAPAQWYLALMALKSGDNEQAENIMRRIAADSEHPFKARAKTFLEAR